MDERAEFEAWAFEQPDFAESRPWDVARTAWQAATQRQQDRIAYVEKVADDAIELGNQQAIRIAELEAQVQALSVDAGRYRWIRSNVGDAYMDLATASEDTIDQRIDAEIAAGKGT